MSNNWTDAVVNAIRRSQRDDFGAVAAIEGILGLSATFDSKTAVRCYNAASVARNEFMHSLEKRKRQPLQAGKTGNGANDKILTDRLAELRASLQVAT